MLLSYWLLLSPLITDYITILLILKHYFNGSILAFTYCGFTANMSLS
jgi:hypothetical protein